MEYLWLFFSLVGLITGFGLLIALVLLKRMVPLNQPPVLLVVGALICMGVASLLGVYLRIQEIPRSILLYRLINAGAWGYAVAAALDYLYKSSLTKNDTSRWVVLAVGGVTAGAAFLTAHPPADSVVSALPKELPILIMLLIEVVTGLLSVVVGIVLLKHTRHTISRPWKIVFRGLGIALLILVPANLLEFTLSLCVRSSGGEMNDGFIFAFGYGIANISLIISLLEAFHSGRGAEPSLSIPVALTKLYGITRREQEVIEKILAGKGNREIASELYISPRTVDTHLSNIFRKCGVNSRLQLIRLISDYGKLRSS